MALAPVGGGMAAAIPGIPNFTQSALVVAQLQATNPSLFRQAFPQQAGIPPGADSLSSLLNNPLITGSNINAGALGGLGGALGGLGGGASVANLQFQQQMAEIDAKYGGLFNMGASLSPVAQQLNQQATLGMQAQLLGLGGMAGGGLGALGVLNGVGLLSPTNLGGLSGIGGILGGVPGFGASPAGLGGLGGANIGGLGAGLGGLLGGLLGGGAQQSLPGGLGGSLGGGLLGGGLLGGGLGGGTDQLSSMLSMLTGLIGQLFSGQR